MNEAADVGAPHRLEQVEGAGQVGPEVAEGLSRRLPGQGETGAVDEGLAPAPHHPVERVAVEEIGGDEPPAVR